MIDGAKRWIGNGTIAGIVVVWARPSTTGGSRGFSSRRPRRVFRPTVIEGKGATRSIWQADIHLDGVRVPAEDLLPGAQSFKDAGRVLVRDARSMRVGRARARRRRLRRGADLRKQRTQFGRPLCGFQIVQERLVACSPR